MIVVVIPSFMNIVSLVSHQIGDLCKYAKSTLPATFKVSAM